MKVASTWKVPKKAQYDIIFNIINLPKAKWLCPLIENDAREETTWSW